MGETAELVGSRCCLRTILWYVCTERKNGVILALKVESLAELKFNPRFRVIVKYLSQLANWLSISSQFDWNILQLLGIPGRILVKPVTQLLRSKWLHFLSVCLCAFCCTRKTYHLFTKSTILCMHYSYYHSSQLIHSNWYGNICSLNIIAWQNIFTLINKYILQNSLFFAFIS